MTTSPEKPSNSVARFLIPVVAIIIAAIGALFFLKSQLSSRSAANPEGAGNAPVSVGIGTEIPDFALTGAVRKPEKFSDVVRESHAKIVLMNFWATWCEACVEEMPSIVKLRDSYRNRGLEVIGINLDENPGAVLPKTEKNLKISFPVFSDTDNKIADFFDVHAIPLSVLIDARGNGRKILYIENGGRNWNDQDIHQQMDEWLGNG